MYRFLWFFGIAFILVSSGCDSQESTKPKTEPHQVVKPQQKIATAEEQKTPLEQAQAVAKQAEEKTIEVKEASEEMAKEAKMEATQQVTAVKEKAEEQINKVTESVISKVAVSKKTPEAIILEASYGNVTFPHAQHAADLECATCHAGTPAAFDITKEVAHKLCKSCHKDGGAGPTGCKDCHKK